MVTKRYSGILFLFILQIFIVCQLGACAGNPQTHQSFTTSPTHTTSTAASTQHSHTQRTAIAIQPPSVPEKPLSPPPTFQATPTISPTTTVIQPSPTVQQTNQPSVQGVEPQPTATELQLMQQLFSLINQDRSNAGLPPYTWNTILVGTAYRHSITMVQCGISHDCPGEPQLCTRIQNAGINTTSCGENVGQAAATPTYWTGIKQIEADMLGEPPTGWHRINLLSPNHHFIGVGIHIDQRGYAWITEDFTN